MTSPSRKSSQQPSDPFDGWSHRLAWILAALAVLFAWVGGLVTTRGDSATMDNTRVIASVGVLLLIALAVAVWRRDGRRWMRWLAFGAIAAVVLLGGLGWLRVIFNEPQLAKLLGCIAPLLCAICAAMVTVTSRAWRTRGPAEVHPAARRTQRMVLIVTVGVYLLILSGAQLRHPSPDDAPGWFTFWLWLQVILSGVVGVAALLLLIQVVGRLRDRRMLVRRAGLLAALFFVQILLGIGTWVTNYGVPGWFRDHVRAIDYTVVAGGPLQVWTTTTHVAVGSLVLMASLAVLLWSHRLPVPHDD